MLLAIVRDVSASINQCELTHLGRHAIDVDLAREQHDAYVDALAALGCEVVRLPGDPTLPDSVFIEDTAVVLDEIAIITRPGAESRRAETAGVEETLARYRPTCRIQAPGTLDGGDVLRVGRSIFVGASPAGRSNDVGLAQLREHVLPCGYDATAVSIHGCLHLKSAVTQVAPHTLLVNPAWLRGNPFRNFECIEVDPSEPFAANGLLLGDTVLFPSAFPRTRERLEARGIRIQTVDVSELAKAEGAVTCCSLVLSV